MFNRLRSLMKIKSLATLAVAVGMLAASCSTPKNITYFQDISTGTVIDPSQRLEIKVKPEDKLSIIVSTQDMALSNLFNLVQNQSRLGNSGGTSVGNASNTADGRTSFYTVDRSGNINFPVIGELHIGGMSRFEVADFIEQKLKEGDFVKDPIVTVEFANTGISILGEVSKPGRYEFNKDRLNIIDALAMAGDLTTNGMRENVIVLRETTGGKQQAYRVDLTNMKSIATSPVYYLQQNDVIYVEPNNKKKRETTASGNSAYSPSFWVSVGSLAVTIATLIITLGK